MLLEVNRDPQEMYPVTPKTTDPKATDSKATDPEATDPKATDPKANEVQSRPQHGDLPTKPAQVDYPSGASSPSSARSAELTPASGPEDNDPQEDGGFSALRRRSRRHKAPNHWPTGNNPRQHEQQEYAEAITRLSSGLDHLVNVRKESRHAAHCVYSFIEGTQADVHEYFKDKVPTKRSWQEMANSPTSIFTPQAEDSVRSIFVQDLGSNALKELGFYLQLNPEFFEQHLSRSGYHEASWQDPLPQTWNTSSAEKDYFSLRWFRPVFRNKEFPPKLSDRTELLTEYGIQWNKTTFVRRKGQPGQRVVTDHQVRCKTNILRQEWNLSADPAAQDTTSEKLVPCCWEERASIYRTTAPGNKRLGTSPCSHILNIISI